MKPGDKVKVRNYKDQTHQIMTVLEVTDKSVKLKHPNIGGFFVIAKELVSPLE